MYPASADEADTTQRDDDALLTSLSSGVAVGRTNVHELQDDPAYKDVYAALSVSEQLVASERPHQRDAWLP